VGRDSAGRYILVGAVVLPVGRPGPPPTQPLAVFVFRAVEDS
jgi:hypothetical protein